MLLCIIFQLMTSRESRNQGIKIPFDLRITSKPASLPTRVCVRTCTCLHPTIMRSRTRFEWIYKIYVMSISMKISCQFIEHYICELVTYEPAFGWINVLDDIMNSFVPKCLFDFTRSTTRYVGCWFMFFFRFSFVNILIECDTAIRWVSVHPSKNSLQIFSPQSFVYSLWIQIQKMIQYYWVANP